MNNSPVVRRRAPEKIWQEGWKDKLLEVLPKTPVQKFDGTFLSGLAQAAKTEVRGMIEIRASNGSQVNFDLDKAYDELTPQLAVIEDRLIETRDRGREIALEPQIAEHLLAMMDDVNGESIAVQKLREIGRALGFEATQKAQTVVVNELVDGTYGMNKIVERTRKSLDGRVLGQAYVSALSMQEAQDLTAFKKLFTETLSTQFAELIYEGMKELVKIDPNNPDKSPVDSGLDVLVLIDADENTPKTQGAEIGKYMNDQTNWETIRSRELADIYKDEILNFAESVDFAKSDEELAEQAGITIPLARKVKDIHQNLTQKNVHIHKESIAYVLMFADDQTRDEVFKSHLSSKLNAYGAAKTRQLFDLIISDTVKEELDRLQVGYKKVVEGLKIGTDYSETKTNVAQVVGLPEQAVEALQNFYNSLDQNTQRPYTIDNNGDYTRHTTGAQILISMQDSDIDSFYSEHVGKGLSRDADELMKLLFRTMLDDSRRHEISMHHYWAGKTVYPILSQDNQENQAKYDALKQRAGQSAAYMFQMLIDDEGQGILGDDFLSSWTK